jgi:alginate O-acetyltransferase complex protein AlgI
MSGLWGRPLELPLPLGISFFTLQGIAYLIDFYRGDAGFMSFREFMLFKAFFAQLIAGPIARANEVLPFLRRLPAARAADLREGLFLIGLGLVKKLIIADGFAVYVDTVFANPAAFNSATLLVGALAFYFQIWGDFSGYTDIGRGSALLFGLRLPENFYSPFYALTPTEWTRRWHVTLGRWVRLYLYVPLGVALRKLLRRTPFYRQLRLVRQAFGLAVTMIAVGLWHGAAWTYVLYGLSLAFLLVCELILRRGKNFFKRIPAWALAVLAWSVFFQAQMAISILFRSHSLEDIGRYFSGIFSSPAGAVSLMAFAGPTLWRIAAVFVLEAIRYYDLERHCYPLTDWLKLKLAPVTLRHPGIATVLSSCLLAGLIVLALAYRTGDAVSGFIYFRF